MNINRNTLGHLEVPDFILVKASEERVGILSCTSKRWIHKYNDMDTMSFEIPFKTNGEKTSFYDLIDTMKHVEVPGIGRFCIKDIEISNEGQDTEYKSVECQDYSCLIGQRYLEDFVINTGETGSIDNVRFYQPGNQSYSLLHLVFEKLPEWSFGYISPSLQTMKRSFSVSRQDAYSFLTKDVSEAFECLFVFDSTNKTVNAYTLAEYGKDTNVHVSYNSLLESTQMSYSIDEIKTAAKLQGDDDLDVRELNIGNDYIYNFSAYASEEFWSASLLAAYTAWNNLVNSPVDLNLFTYKTGVITRAELQGKTYSQAYTLLLSKYQDYYTQISKWQSTMLPYMITSRKNPGYGTISYTEDGSDAVTFSKQTSTQLVTSLPGSGDSNVLYLVKNTNNMFRWNGSWVNVNLWYNCALAELKSLQAGAEKLQAVAMKSGYGDAESSDTNIQKRYVDTYLPALYMYNALTKQIQTVNSTISTLESNQTIIQTDKTVIVNKVSMRNNFTAAQLKELSAFIREDEISSDNFVVTDGMTESERFDMLYALLDYGQKELAKVAAPQIQFSADLVNLFAIPEFDNYSGDFDVGNYVWVTLRDDYSVKAKILEIEFNFLDQSDFAVTFGNVAKRARNIFTDVTNALNAATAAATSVSFGASNWNAASEQTDSIGKALADGLLSQSYYLANAEDNETRIDENGLWITTTTGSHGRENTDNYDSIYLGGGRILFTEDGWRTVSMSTGRGDVQMPTINSSGQLVFVTESKFGVFADFLLAGYVGGTTIVGGDIYSSNYKTSSNKNSGNAGAHINLTDGTFEFNSKTTGKKRLTLSGDTLEVNGVIQASSGHIGSNDNGEGGFIIASNKMYNNKSTLEANASGVYVGTDGIGLGATTTYTTTGSNVTKSIFQVDSSGNLYAGSVNVRGRIHASSGYIGNGSSGFTINSTSIVNGKTSLEANANGVYVGTDGIGLGKLASYTTGSGNVSKSVFQVDSAGNLYAGSVNIRGRIHASSGYIGDGTNGFTINPTYITNGKSSLYDTNEGIFLGTNGISLGANNVFSVTNKGYLTTASGKIGGATIASDSIHAGNNNWFINSDGTASFKHITISDWAKINGVQWGSNFGSLNFDNGITWGSFGGSSSYSSNKASPFSGNCVSHIQSIAADYIYANYLKAMEAEIDELWVETANINTLVATKASITELKAVSAEVDTIKADYVKASQITTYTLSATQIRWNGHSVTSSSGYVASNYPSCSVTYDDDTGEYHAHLSGFTKMNIMGYYQ